MKHGWKTIFVEGDAKLRGFAHGSVLSEDLKKLLEVFPCALKRRFNITLEEYIALCKKRAWAPFAKKCDEWREELEGMVEGALSRGVIVSVDFLFGWNMYLSIYSELDKDKKKDSLKKDASLRCSAFIAVGDATKNGDIVMAHNTHCDFVLAQFFNIVQHTKPSKGHPFVMQTAPGLLCSAVDWFLCGSGIIGCETTIANITYAPTYGTPYFCRIRKCMQYAKTLDECEQIMREDNAGDYPCGWLLGDINTNEIMLLEVAKTVASRRTTSGVFYGSNFVHDGHIRTKETTNDHDFKDAESSIRCRGERLDWLLNKTYWGKIDASIAKRIISDHYDTHKKTSRKGSRGICKHLEADKVKPLKNQFGAIDGKVTTSALAKRLAFWGRWGSSCGRVYAPSRTLKRRIPYLPHFRGEPWTWIRPQNKN